MQRDYFRALQEIRKLREAREEAPPPEPVEMPQVPRPQGENRLRFEKPVSTSPAQARPALENLALRL